MLTQQGVNQREGQCNNASLTARRPPHLQQLAAITRPVGLTGMCFDRIGETVQRIRGKSQHSHQYRIDRHNVTAKPGTKNGQRTKAQLQQQRAQHDVAIERQQASKIAEPRHFQHGPANPSHHQHLTHHAQTNQQRGVFGDGRGQRRPLHVHMQSHHQPQIEHDIEHVPHNQQDHRRTSILNAQQPPQQHQIG